MGLHICLYSILKVNKKKKRQKTKGIKKKKNNQKIKEYFSYEQIDEICQDRQIFYS